MTELALSGLRADNPLAFLAALGTLRAAAAAFDRSTVRMRWQISSGAWTPALCLTAARGQAAVESLDEDELVARLHDWMSNSSGQRAFAIADDLTLSPQAFRAVSASAVAGATPRDRAFADFIAAFGCDAVELRENGKASGKIADTAFRTMSGAGHQHFLGFMRTLATDVGPGHLRRALFAPWRYDDPLESHSMRWDPADDVRYALRWRDASGYPERKRSGTMWGANRLAIEALPLLPTMPTEQGGLATVGFSISKAEGAVWTWPVWSGSCTVETVRSMLSLGELQRARPSRATLARMGIREVFRCHRIRQGKYRNLTPAQAV